METVETVEEVETHETTEAENDNQENVSQVEESEEVVETAEERVERLAKETESKQRKIDRQTAAYRKLQETYENQRKEIEQLKQSIKPAEKQEPNIDDYETHEDYVNAVVEYRTEATMREAQEKMLREQEQLQLQKITQERLSLRQSQEAEYLKENPMYKASSQEVDDFIRGLNVHPNVADAVIEQMYDGNVPQVIDYFGSNNGENLEKLRDISQMSPAKAAVEIYKLQERLKASPVEKKEKTTPKPIEEKKGGGAPKKDLSQGDVLKNLGLK